MKILMVASEANPLAKTGGLADVVYALSRELTIMGEEVVIAMPYYAKVKDKFHDKIQWVASVDVFMSWRKQTADIYRTYIDGITYYLIDNAYYFNRTEFYGYYDDTERFAFFSLAVRNMLQVIKFQPDVIHLHDWQPGMLPVLVREQNKYDPFYKNIKFVTTIHNPAFQGFFDPFYLNDFYGLSDELFKNGKVRFKGICSSLKAAIVYSDKITTVSPTHASELLSSEGSQGLNDIIVLRQQDFSGILNGIDYGEWNPSTDSQIAFHYNAVTYKKAKVSLKAALMDELHLKNEGQALFGIVSRLTWQKGIDLILAGAQTLLNSGASLVVLGSGEYVYEQELEKLRAQFPDKMAIYIGYNEAFAHKIYASSDFLLMPSLFEPCGISQMIALRYGTLPVVRLTGGLKDTVIPLMEGNIDFANGFGFYAYEDTAVQNTVRWALTNYAKPAVMRELIHHAMTSDNDWKTSAGAYVKLYQEMTERK